MSKLKSSKFFCMGDEQGNEKICGKGSRIKTETSYIGQDEIFRSTVEAAKITPPDYCLMNLTRVIPWSLMDDEFPTNSTKHAFPADRMKDAGINQSGKRFEGKGTHDPAFFIFTIYGISSEIPLEIGLGSKDSPGLYQVNKLTMDQLDEEFRSWCDNGTKLDTSFKGGL